MLSIPGEVSAKFKAKKQLYKDKSNCIKSKNIKKKTPQPVILSDAIKAPERAAKFDVRQKG